MFAKLRYIALDTTINIKTILIHCQNVFAIAQSITFITLLQAVDSFEL
jgi:hypothetical protein